MIGFFDSGSGGLTVLSAFLKVAPRADVVYFGDIVHAPYGVRPGGELAELTQSGVEFLRGKGAQSLVSACNSVSASVLAGAADDMPYIEMSTPTAQFLHAYAGKRFLLIATPATVESKLYEHAVGDAVSLDSLAIPDLAGAIEFGKSSEEIQHIVEEAFMQKKDEKYDGLILGCTHYPLVRGVIEETARKFFGQTLVIVDPAEAVAQEAAVRFDTQGEGKLAFYISQDSPMFRRRVSELFSDRHYTVSVI